MLGRCVSRVHTFHKNTVWKIHFESIFFGPIRVSHQNMIFWNKKNQPTLVVGWRIPKGFLILTTFRGCTSHFRFGHFYIVDFHSALTFSDRDLKIEGWVKIYNVKMSKTEMACAPPKCSRNQKSFWDPLTYHPNTTGVGWVFLFQKIMFWWDTLGPIHFFFFFFWNTLFFWNKC